MRAHHREERDGERLMQEDEEGDGIAGNCTTGHSIGETDWNQCDSCGKLTAMKKSTLVTTAGRATCFVC